MKKTVQKFCINKNNKTGHFSLFLVLMTLLACGCESQETVEPITEENSLEDLRTKGSFETDAFITEWIVPKDVDITLPLDPSFSYDFVVDWGDNSKLTVVSNQTNFPAKHRYSKAGVYQIRILGICETWRWANENTSKKYLTKVVQWGNVEFTSLSSSFYECTALNSIAAGIPNVVSYNSTFANCTNLTSLPEGLFANCNYGKDFSGIFCHMYKFTVSSCRSVQRLC